MLDMGYLTTSAFHNELIKRASSYLISHTRKLRTGELHNLPGFTQLFMMDSGVKRPCDSKALAFPTMPLDTRDFILPLTIFSHSLFTSWRYKDAQRSAGRLHRAASPLTACLSNSHPTLLVTHQRWWFIPLSGAALTKSSLLCLDLPFCTFI